MQQGFIFPFFDGLFRACKYINLVELFKFIAQTVAYARRSDATQPPSREALKQSAVIAIDVYQLFKWGVLIAFWWLGVENTVARIFVFYLIGTNLFTYFYYQVWGSAFVQVSDRDTDNRRFINTLIGIGFFLTAFAYLYDCHFAAAIQWPEAGATAQDALYLSLSTAFTLPLEGFAPITATARLLFVAEVVNTFMFFIIILTNAIPNHINKGS